jgi:hypothetical protein
MLEGSRSPMPSKAAGLILQQNQVRIWPVRAACALFRCARACGLEVPCGRFDEYPHHLAHLRCAEHQHGSQRNPAGRTISNGLYSRSDVSREPTFHPLVEVDCTVATLPRVGHKSVCHPIGFTCFRRDKGALKRVDLLKDMGQFVEIFEGPGAVDFDCVCAFFRHSPKSPLYPFR